MIKQNQRILNFALIVIDWICLALSHLGAYLFCKVILLEPVLIWKIVLLYSVLLPFNTLLLSIMDLYGAKRSKPFRRELWLIFIDAVILAIGVVVAQEILGQSLFPAVLPIVIGGGYFCTDGLVRYLLRRLLRSLRSSGYNQKYLLLIGDGELCRQFIRKVMDNPQYGYRFYGCLSDRTECGENVDGVPVVGRLNTLSRHLDSGHIDEVVIAIGLKEYDKIQYMIASCEKSGIKINVIPAFYQYLPSNPRMDEFDGIPFMVLRKIPLSNLLCAAVKRVFDVVCAVVCLVLAAPLFVVLFAVLGYAGGGVIYKQERIGLNFKPFTMYKFRTMTGGTTAGGWTEKKDPRRTRLGVFLRKFSIDELPQLVNVLKGEMSIVGPRPELETFVRQFKETIPRYMVRHQVKPGITGWAQIHNLRGDTSIEERIKSDIYYIENWSLSLDIRIVFKTLTKALYNPYE